GNCVEPVPCQNNAVCRQIVPIFQCQNGFCAAPFSQCQRNSDCAAGSSCVFGVCAPLGGPECVRDVDCPAGELCEAERCVAAP
ncbi:MAG: hypothetical protein KC613_23880, partial [Myxococcales bacterium]|nr:hypothetical protein [Myxococcales bacterium]